MLHKLLSPFQNATYKEPKTIHYSQDELRTLQKSLIPKHVAIIPDGNRRWAKQHHFFPEEGHRIGADVILTTIKAASELGIKTLTFYIFSTENWLRPQREINAQMRLLEKYLVEERQNMLDNGVKFDTIGNLSKFPLSIIEIVNETRKVTSLCSKINVVFAMNYGARDELLRAFINILDAYEDSKITREQISEDLISNNLDTAKWPDPELLIRTSGEHRISNFLLWQLSYSELFTTEVFWPEFTPQHLLGCIQEYQKRERRLGG